MKISSNYFAGVGTINTFDRKYQHKAHLILQLVWERDTFGRKISEYSSSDSIASTGIIDAFGKKISSDSLAGAGIIDTFCMKT